MKIRYLIAIVGAACLFGGSALAQTPPPPKHHGLLGGMMGRHQHPMMGHPIMGGRIIGNKRTHVYHLAGDKNLPAPQNRVYFRTEAEAMRAGYRRAGSVHSLPHHGMTGGHMHGMMGNHMHGKMKPAPAHP